MERWVRWAKRFNMVVGIGAMLMLTSAPLFLVGNAFAEGETEINAPVAAQHAATEKAALLPDGHAKVRCWGFVAAALATGIGSIAAGYAVGSVGTAAMGAVAEKPELMGKSLIYVALAEGIAIYGLLIAIIVLAKV